MPAPAPRPLSDYPQTTFDKLRYNDTDRQGHVNNAVFATLLETGRVEFLYAPDGALRDPGCAFVIRRPVAEFLKEITWPGRVDIGTGVTDIGRSSFTLSPGAVPERAVRGHGADHHRSNERKHQALAPAVARHAATPASPEAGRPRC